MVNCKIKELLSNSKSKILFDEPMLKHTSFKIGGPADIFIEISSIDYLSEVIVNLKKYSIPFFIIGKGSNLLVSDNGINGVVIRLTDEFKKISLVNSNTIECGAGASLAKLCVFAQQNALSGLEFAYGIPGSVGGAVFMNAGAYGGEIKDVILSVRSLTRDNNIRELNLKDLDFAYRHSVYQNNGDIILSAKFKLKKGNSLEIKESMAEFMRRRKEKQPLSYPSAGSVFKRPVGNYAGALIQQCGLQGKNIGGAMVSTKHAGFIVNTGNASCQDVINLIEMIKSVVFSKTGVKLESEIKIIGNI